MRVVSFRIGARESWGTIEDEQVVDVGASISGDGGLRRWLADGDASAILAASERAPRHALGAVEWRPVVPDPEKILCIGVNYEDHRAETGRAAVAHPTVFTRFASSLTGHGCAMLRPRVSTDFDFEGELAVIIGKAGRYIARERAFEHVAGYAAFNDGSIRDWQRHTSQFTPGKNFPGTGALGPWMVTADEIGADLPRLRLRTRLNETVVQDALLGNMIFDVPALIEYCSSFTELRPGDVIATGTPGGVGAGRKPPLWLQPGDTVDVEIERVGTLRNVVAEETGSTR